MQVTQQYRFESVSDWLKMYQTPDSDDRGVVRPDIEAAWSAARELRNDPDQPPAAETPGEPAGPNRRSVASDGST